MSADTEGSRPAEPGADPAGEPQSPPAPGPPPGGPRPGAGPEPTEEEMRAAMEEQLRKVRVEDLLLESVAGIVNLTARRIAKPDERDLEQARVGIEAVRALVPLLPEEASGQIRNALSQLQVLFAQATAGEGGPDQPDPPEGESPPGPGSSGPPPPPPGPTADPAGRPRSAEPPPRLWTPRGSE